MKQRNKETLGLVINGLSIALFFYWASTLDVPNNPFPMETLAWILSGSGLALIVLSVAALRANREAGLITQGIYGVVRHPMYLGAILLFLSWIFSLPQWFIVLLSSVNVAIVYWFILRGEHRNLAKFGDSYRRYMEVVPRVNLAAGLLRFLRNK